MSTYKRFEELPAWKEAVELAVAANALVRSSPLQRDRDYTSQLRRAALSVSNNIAEGFERGTTAELLSFIYIARGVCWRGSLHDVHPRTSPGVRYE